MKKRSISMGIGIMSLLMLFIILCMVILSVLSYQNASQSDALAMREKEALTKYYEAQASASILYAQLQQLQGSSIQELYEEANTRGKSMAENVTISLENDILTLVIEKETSNPFMVQVNEDLEILKWGYGEER